MREMLLHPLRFMGDHRFTRARLSDYVDGDLDERARHRIEHHAGVCPKCRHMLESLKRTLAELVGLRDGEAHGDIAAGVIERLRNEA
jgi:anti-sigma factor RsiW